MRKSLTALGLSALASIACTEPPPEPSVTLRPVRVAEAVAAEASRTRVFSGVTRSELESSLSFRVAGTVERVAVALGERVSRGQLIARLDPTDFGLVVAEATSALETARAEARASGAAWDRTRELYENDNASLADLERARAAAEATTSQVSTLETRVAQARRQLSFAELRSPADGAIAAISIEAGENIGAGTQVAQIAGGERPEVEIAIPELLISAITEGAAVVVAFDALPGEHFAATVLEVGIAPAARESTFPVRVALSSQPQGVRSGMAAEVEFSFADPSLRGQVVVPIVSVGEDDDGRFVWVASGLPGGRATVHRRQVEVAEISSQGLRLTGGIEAGELVVTAGLSRLHEGMLVRMPGSAG